MGLNREYIGREFPPVVYEVTEEAIYKYAWAIGARNVTYYNYNGYVPYITISGMAPPSFAVVHELLLAEKLWSDEGLHGGPEQLAHNLLMLVHGEQDMRFYRPIRPGDRIISRAKIKNIEDKGSGELLVINVTSTDEKGEKFVESDWGIFIRGIGSGQKKKDEKKDGKKEEVQIGAETQPIFRKVIRVPNDITYRYAEASGDRNPIHIDEKVAKAAGLRGIIVHGLCTLSMTMRAIIECYLDSDPARLKRLACRFASPVYPGDTLIADGWELGRKDGRTVLGFEVTRRGDDVKVLKSGISEVDI
jgi:acyl dehydratase